MSHNHIANKPRHSAEYVAEISRRHLRIRYPEPRANIGERLGLVAVTFLMWFCIARGVGLVLISR